MALNYREHNMMHGVQEARAIQNQPSSTKNGSTSEDEALADSDEPPDPKRYLPLRPAPLKSTSSTGSDFGKSQPFNKRKESLLTKALHNESDEDEEEDADDVREPRRGLSMISTISNGSSTAGLTSDDGLTSPGTRTSTPSPPPPATVVRPIFNTKPFEQVTPVQIRDDNTTPLMKSDAPSERSVEVSLGRKRCITFACGRKDAPKPSAAGPASKPADQDSTATKPTKKVCSLKFVCPMKPSAQAPSSPTLPKKRSIRAFSPAPARIGLSISPKTPAKHRDSDSTVKNDSPKTVRKVSLNHRRKYSDNSSIGHTEATRFHEFASSEEEVDDWVQEVTCHRRPLTVNDTLSKENVLRKHCQEAEEEAIEEEEEELDAEVEEEEDLLEDDEDEGEEEEDEDEDEDHHGDESEEVDADDVVYVSDDEVSDGGFQTDDEEGFANSDTDSDAGSDYEWWAPGRSTAATSTDDLKHFRPATRRRASDLSVSSSDGGNVSPNTARSPILRHKSKRKPKPLQARTGTPDLPDSTDFVCGTLDEDRPIEEAYITAMEQRRKAKLTPQDIDPSFPTSDPEMDEEDEDDDYGRPADESDAHMFMHGQPDGDESERRGRKFSGMRKKSPLHSPNRMRSPPPPSKRGRTLKSPPPPTKRGPVHRSPPPRKLFGQSPTRLRSPPPMRRLMSPPASRSTSIATSPTRIPIQFAALAQRPELTHTTSLPRTPSVFGRVAPSALAPYDPDDEDVRRDLRSRGAIDIVKGLEKKRQFRKEKLYQKSCRKAAQHAARDKERRPQPGKGAERMRELGMQLAEYNRGSRRADEGAEHILSI